MHNRVVQKTTLVFWTTLMHNDLGGVCRVRFVPDYVDVAGPDYAVA